MGQLAVMWLSGQQQPRINITTSSNFGFTLQRTQQHELHVSLFVLKLYYSFQNDPDFGRSNIRQSQKTDVRCRNTRPIAFEFETCSHSGHARAR